MYVRYVRNHFSWSNMKIQPPISPFLYHTAITYCILNGKWKWLLLGGGGEQRLIANVITFPFWGTFPFLYDSVVKSIFRVKYHSSNSVEGLLGPVLGGAHLAHFLDAQVFRRIKVPGQVFLHSIVKKQGEQCYEEPLKWIRVHLLSHWSRTILSPVQVCWRKLVSISPIGWKRLQDFRLVPISPNKYI